MGKYNVSLNYFEKLWAAWYLYMQNDVLATGIMSFVMHETVYFGRSLPWIIVDCIPYFRKYKIQHVSFEGSFIRGGWRMGANGDCFVEQDSDGEGAVAVCYVGAAVAFHGRIATDLVRPRYDCNDHIHQLT